MIGGIGWNSGVERYIKVVALNRSYSPVRNQSEYDYI